jgi:hypothetical protein
MDEAMDDLLDTLDELEDELADIDERDRFLRMTVWVDGGEIIGRKIDKVMDADFELSYRRLVDGKAAYYEARVDADGESALMEGEFTKSGKAWNGEMEFSVKYGYYGDMVAFTALCEGIEFSDGIITGDINISGEFDGGGYCDLDVSLGKSGKSQTITVQGEVSNGYEEIDIGAATLTYSVGDINRLKTDMPSDANYGVIVGDYSDDNADIGEALLEELEALAEEYDDDGDNFMYSVIEVIYYFVDDLVW